MRPKLSIITPSLNQAAFIERTLRSVLDQGYENLEYIVVDGGSTDGTQEIVERYADRLAYWVSEPDRGQTDALNKGLARATGDIVAYINSDDYYLPGAFDAAVSVLGQSDALWAAGSARFVDPDDNETEVWSPELPPKRRYWWVIGPWGVPQAATFWRREVFERFGRFREDMHYVFDTEYGIRLALAGQLPALIDGELAVRVVHPEAKSWDLDKFAKEQTRFVGLFAPQLEPGERVALYGLATMQKIGGFRALRFAAKVKRRLPFVGSRNLLSAGR